MTKLIQKLKSAIKSVLHKAFGWRSIRSELGARIDEVANNSLSYYNFNSQQISKVRTEIWEGNQQLLDRMYRGTLFDQKNPIRVKFLVPDTTLWDVYKPIYECLLHDPCFDAEVIAFKRTDIESDKTHDDVTRFFVEQGIKARVVGFDGPVPPLEQAEVDIAFFTLGSTAYPAPYQIEYLSLFCRTCYVSYGVLLANEDEYQFAQDFHKCAWRIYASTARENELYTKMVGRYRPNVVVSGYPKFDLVRSLPKNIESTKRPVVIWAPHWSVGQFYPRFNFGMFETLAEPMFALFKEYSNIDFVFKPHPNLQYALAKSGLMPDEQYLGYLRRLESLPNISVHKHGGYFDLFAKSAGMISESVSFIAEYLPTGHPFLFLSRPDRAKLNQLGEDLLALHYDANDISGIKHFIENCVLKSIDPKQQERIRHGKALLELKDESTAEFIRADLLKSFRVNRQAAQRENQKEL